MLRALPLLACLLASPALGQTASAPPAPQSPTPMPFVRASRSPFILPATTTPQQYMVTQPVGSTTYRGYNPCANADVRVMSVAPLEPIATQPVTVNGKTLPGVLRVTSKTETIDEFSGTRLGRGPETLGSASNPNGGQDRIISIVLVPIPGYAADLTGVTCLYEHMYGKGS
ncbi:hypothetical protein [Methylobacterium indicum]|uniref:Uncharacterized protein n=1 Tax=Methylobacterium indicum TaxID=1775910 RepID=A0ABR5GZC3_9HYPH|nr:hypothetical protein [Methylobacterium indicum]KMO15779.1 hypothetical protein QR79_23885 [Methylobacterium indicum]KMO18055.1 hypothetical protein QR78_16230 [Methylobacterium indicum]